MTADTRSTLHSRNANYIGNRFTALKKVSTKPSSGTSKTDPGGNRCSSPPADIDRGSLFAPLADENCDSRGGRAQFRVINGRIGAIASQLGEMKTRVAK